MNVEVEPVSPDDSTDTPSGDDDRSAAGVGILGAGDGRRPLEIEYAWVEYVFRGSVGYVFVESVGYVFIMKCAFCAMGVGSVGCERVGYVPGAYVFVYGFVVSVCIGENAPASGSTRGVPATVGLLASTRADSGDSAAEA